MGHTHSSHLHAHKAGDAQHVHTRSEFSQRVLVWAVILTLSFATIEAAAGWWAQSLALISDAGHMVTDSAALALALLAQYIARRPPSAQHSFGYGRAESLAAFVNALAMLALVAWIAFEAFSRIREPHQVQGMTVTIVAVIGLIINLIVAWLLSKDQKSVNTRAALVHVMGDLLGSIAALIAGLVISYTGWMMIDPILSIFVCVLVLRSTVDVLRESYHFLMQGVPEYINYVQLGEDLSAVSGVLAVHDLHVWEMSPGEPALMGHVEVENLQDWPQTLTRIRHLLHERYRIEHITLQAEMPS